MSDAGVTNRATEEVVDLCRDLIRIDSSNPTSNERAIAEYVAGQLTDAGLTPEIYESEPGRASVVARWAGEDSSRPGLVLHGHLDVVPANADDWQVDPFAAEVRDVAQVEIAEKRGEFGAVVHLLEVFAAVCAARADDQRIRQRRDAVFVQRLQQFCARIAARRRNEAAGRACETRRYGRTIRFPNPLRGIEHGPVDAFGQHLHGPQYFAAQFGAADEIDDHIRVLAQPVDVIFDVV